MAPPNKDWDSLVKEVDKLNSKGKAPPVTDSLDALLHTLRNAKAKVENGTGTPADAIADVLNGIEQKKGIIEERQKEYHNSLGKLGKALDKKFPNALPPSPPLFSSPKAVAALEHTIAIHFIRTGSFEVADTFLKESEVGIPDVVRSQFVEMHRILTALRNQDIGPALEWASARRLFLGSRSSPLEFNLHRSKFLRILFSSSPPNVNAALSYSRKHFPPLYALHTPSINRLISIFLYLPNIKSSPYADLSEEQIHTDVEVLFTREYCASLGMSKELPLRIVGDIGGGGALAKIEKGKKIMRDRKSEWSQTDELPIEIPLPARNRYHSIFACPVSKEQSTDLNPPMMISCGHVISKESLGRLPKSSGRVKCPYCPKDSSAPALRVFF